MCCAPSTRALQSSSRFTECTRVTGITRRTCAGLFFRTHHFFP